MAVTVGMSVLAVRICPVEELELAAALARVPGLSRAQEAAVQKAAAFAPRQALRVVVVVRWVMDERTSGA